LKIHKNISPETIKAYLAGTLSHAQTHEFEKAMLSDAVLRDIVEGYEISRDKKVDFGLVKYSLSESLQKRVQNEESEIYPLWKRVPLYARAASVLLFLGLGIYILTTKNDMNVEGKMAVIPSQKEEKIAKNEPEVLPQNAPISKVEIKKEMSKIVAENRVGIASKNTKTKAIVHENSSSTYAESALEESVVSNSVIVIPEVVPPVVAYDAPAVAVVPVPSAEMKSAGGTYAKKAVAQSSVEQNLTGYSAEPSISQDDYLKYLKNNLRKPKQAVEKQIVGEVVVEFLVNDDGKFLDFKVIKSLGYGCDEEAIRVIAEGPSWRPKMEEGKTRKQIVRQVIIF
jgi:TonB family protein